ncbi:Predicted Fe-Mo cluster-binding protein, NifX family [Malonomonas rubra DSM 5091]|uniref:Predicted Fe-Mo cluster-binding protein, NifX family n=1 Tax=Malonomonas rubra DSM 5091 TaxID=1122189 RepID=A0A1M6HQ09_MALRU|nr:NifB/NifX family molybdenum-iron cluster-binding protein [Malonomonas rubra]SHJ24280.1 Predicted Fe-Mo cluster-binding protein, NifX family [Malonomonas rubra DSM 5091]
MIVAVTAQEGRIDSPIDERFGRAPFFMIANSDTMEVYAFDNSEGVNAGNGAGTGAAQLMAEQKVEVLYTGKVGPKASEALDKAGIKVVEGISGTVEEVLSAALQNVVMERAAASQQELEIPPSKPVSDGAIRVAIPSDSEDGMASTRSGHFGKCNYYTLVDIAGSEVVGVQSMKNGGHSVGGCDVPVRLLKGWDVNKVVVAGIGGRPLAGFLREGIQVYSGLGDTVNETVSAYTQGQLGPIRQDQVCGGGA